MVRVPGAFVVIIDALRLDGQLTSTAKPVMAKQAPCVSTRHTVVKTPSSGRRHYCGARGGTRAAVAVGPPVVQHALAGLPSK